MWAVFVLSLIALPVTAYLIYLHYVPESATFCDFNDTFNCDVVNKSEWSYVDLGFMQLPVSVMGFFTYLLFAIASMLLAKGYEFKKIWHKLDSKYVLWFMAAVSVIGFSFQLHLTYIEAYVLFTYCVFCLASQVLIAFIMLLFIAALFKKRPH